MDQPWAVRIVLYQQLSVTISTLPRQLKTVTESHPLALLLSLVSLDIPFQDQKRV